MHCRTAGLDKKERMSTKFLYPCSNFFSCIVKVGFFWGLTMCSLIHVTEDGVLHSYNGATRKLNLFNTGSAKIL
jgi:hypothetical protein